MRMFILLAFFTSLNSFGNTPATKGLILSKLESGSLKMESILIPLLEGAPGDFISMYSSRQKMAFPEFDREFLYVKYTYDSNYEYRFFWDFQSKKCLYETTPRNHSELSRTCLKEQFECIGKLPKNSSQNEIHNCMRSKSCETVAKNRIKHEEIDKKHCEKIYNKKL